MDRITLIEVICNLYLNKVFKFKLSVRLDGFCSHEIKRN